MERFLGRFSSQAYALMRIVVGFLFLCHGLQKVFGLFGGSGFGASPPMIKVAGLIELVGGGLVMVGLFTGWAAFLSSGQMAAAYFMAHFGLSADSLLPIQNKGELAVFYCFVFLYMATRGDGVWSVGALMGKGSSSGARSTM